MQKESCWAADGGIFNFFLFFFYIFLLSYSMMGYYRGGVYLLERT